MSDPLEHKVSITQDTQLSRERREGTDLTRFVFDQTRGRLRLTSRPNVVSSANEKKRVLPAVVWRRSAVTAAVVVVVTVVVVGPAPKWNDKGRMRRGTMGRGRGARGEGEFNRWVPLTRLSSSSGSAEDGGGGGGSMICK